MSQQNYINGKYFSREDAKISVYDHGLLYGDGVFEGMRIYSGKVFRLQEHLIRLSESGRAIGLEMPIEIGEMTSAEKHKFSHRAIAVQKFLAASVHAAQS